MEHEQARAESLEEQWQKLPLSNDFMFCHVLSDLDTCRQFIERLLHIHIDRLEYVQPQKEMHVAADAKGIRFDLYNKRPRRRLRHGDAEIAQAGSVAARTVLSVYNRY